MTEIQTNDHTTNLTKFYSQRAISTATFFGGPLAAGILIRQNFINSGKDEYGKYALYIGIFSTILLFAILFSIPEQIINKIPSFIIPAIYTGIIYLIVEYYQGQTLKNHKEKHGQFYSGWKAAGIGAICTIFIMLGVFGYIYTAPEDFDTSKYNNGMAEFQKNEEKALELFNLIDTINPYKAIDFIKETGLPTWQKNIQILDELDNIDGLYQEIKNQNKILREYCQLRIKSYELISKALTQNTNIYDLKITQINNNIGDVLKQLQK